MKLFNIEANKRTVSLYFETYKGNRIALKLLRLLGSGGVYEVKETNSKEKNIRIFEVSVLSNKSEDDIIQDLKNEIVSYIPDNFTKNYIFYFSGNPLGFIRSFEFGIHEIKKVVCYHKIKEINKSSITPEKNIFL